VSAVGCAEGLTASASVEILRGRRLSGSSARDAASWVLIVVGASLGAGLGAAGGVFGAAVAGLGEGDGSGVGGTEAADRMAPGGIDGGAVGEPAVCGGAVASSNAGATGSN
jgi:hypothetical protein